MTEENYKVGDLVILLSEGWRGISAVISRPVTEASDGHALVHQDGHILGVEVALGEIQPADETSQGFAQLAYNLIKLGSHVIEQTLVSS